MISFYLVTGFLGSGKTTFLKNVLESPLPDNLKVAVIQNEFAPSGIDGKDLKATGKKFKLMEINNGSVFCVCLMVNFIDMLDELIMDYKPDMVFLEASGLSDPVNLLELLQAGKIKSKIRMQHVFAIADSLNFEKNMSALPRVRHQLMVADTILLNKIDLYAKEPGELLEKVHEINPFAQVVPTHHCQFDWEQAMKKVSKPGMAAGHFGTRQGGDRPGIQVSVLRHARAIPFSKLETFIDKIKGQCLRLKGFLNLVDGKVVAISLVHGIVEWKEIKHYTGPTELICFGQLDMKELRQEFLQYIEG